MEIEMKCPHCGGELIFHRGTTKGKSYDYESVLYLMKMANIPFIEDADLVTTIQAINIVTSLVNQKPADALKIVNSVKEHNLTPVDLIFGIGEYFTKGYHNTHSWGYAIQMAVSYKKKRKAQNDSLTKLPRDI